MPSKPNADQGEPVQAMVESKTGSGDPTVVRYSSSRFVFVQRLKRNSAQALEPSQLAAHFTRENCGVNRKIRDRARRDL
jgi:hypothetical protein